MVIQKTPDEIELMARAGAVLAAVHEVLAEAVAPGVSTAELDGLAAAEIAARGAEPSFLGHHGYPATLCTSVNDQIVHALPSASVRLRAGDVVSLDCGVIVDGYHSDAACTWVVGGREQADERTLTLVDAAYVALWAGIAALRPGNRLGDVSYAIGAEADRHGLGVIAEHDGHVVGGHGIGRQMHEDPLVPGRGRPGHGMRLRPGLVFAIEPMFTLGTPAPRSPTTAGPSAPSTAPAPPTGSTRWRSPRRARGSSPPAPPNATSCPPRSAPPWPDPAIMELAALPEIDTAATSMIDAGVVGGGP